MTPRRPANLDSAKRPTSVTIDTPLGSTSLTIVAIETLLATLWILLIIIAYIKNYILFNEYNLIHLGLWLAVALNTLGTASAILALLRRRSASAKLLDALGLLVNAVLLAGGIYVLAAIHR